MQKYNFAMHNVTWENLFLPIQTQKRLNIRKNFYLHKHENDLNTQECPESLLNNGRAYQAIT